MKLYSNQKFHFIYILIFALAAVIACEDNILVEDSALQLRDTQAIPYSIESADNQSGIKPIEGQYIVIFKERWQEMRTAQTAVEVRAFTNQFLKEAEIPADSVVARFELALRGFTARIDEAKAKALMNDPRVDYVEQDKWAKVISFLADDDTTMTSLLSQVLPLIQLQGRK